MLDVVSKKNVLHKKCGKQNPFSRLSTCNIVNITFHTDRRGGKAIGFNMTWNTRKSENSLCEIQTTTTTPATSTTTTPATTTPAKTTTPATSTTTTTTTPATSTTTTTTTPATSTTTTTTPATATTTTTRVSAPSIPFPKRNSTQTDSTSRLKTAKGNTTYASTSYLFVPSTMSTTSSINLSSTTSPVLGTSTTLSLPKSSTTTSVSMPTTMTSLSMLSTTTSVSSSSTKSSEKTLPTTLSKGHLSAPSITTIVRQPTSPLISTDRKEESDDFTTLPSIMTSSPEEITTEAEEQSFNWLLIVQIASGSAVLILIIVVIAMCCTRKRKRDMEKIETEQPSHKSDVDVEQGAITGLSSRTEIAGSTFKMELNNGSGKETYLADHRVESTLTESIDTSAEAQRNPARNNNPHNNEGLLLGKYKGDEPNHHINADGLGFKSKEVGMDGDMTHITSIKHGLTFQDVIITECKQRNGTNQDSLRISGELKGAKPYHKEVDDTKCQIDIIVSTDNENVGIEGTQNQNETMQITKAEIDIYEKVRRLSGQHRNETANDIPKDAQKTLAVAAAAMYHKRASSQFLGANAERNNPIYDLATNIEKTKTESPIYDLAKNISHVSNDDGIHTYSSKQRGNNTFQMSFAEDGREGQGTGSFQYEVVHAVSNSPNFLLPSAKGRQTERNAQSTYDVMKDVSGDYDVLILKNNRMTKDARLDTSESQYGRKQDQLNI